MIVTIRTRDEKINVFLKDIFNKKAIKKAARKEIKRRWPDVLKETYKLTWRY